MCFWEINMFEISVSQNVLLVIMAAMLNSNLHHIYNLCTCKSLNWHETLLILHVSTKSNSTHVQDSTHLVKTGLLDLSLKTDIVYHNRNFFIPKIIVIFRTDLHKMKIKHWIIGEYATKRCFLDLNKLTIVTGS
jgi:hypothetical protein